MTQNNPLDSSAKPLLIVLSGPSGAGKDAVLARMRELRCPITFITTSTTRPKRATETDKVDYCFVSKEEFQDLIQRNELLEWARVYENFYGVPKRDVRSSLSAGKDVIVKVDVQGAATIKKMVPQALFIFLSPPSLAELFTRLEQRHTESAESLAIRERTAEAELKELPLFDYLVISRHNKVDEAVADIMAIIRSEKCRVLQRDISL